MDAEGERRWRGAIAPFDGVTIFLSDQATLFELRPMLIPVVEILHAHFHDATLYTLDDWHQHDGYVNRAKPTIWQHLQSFLSTDDEFKKISAGDDYVRTAFFTETYAFYLRMYLDVDALYSPHQHYTIHGDFDATCQEPLATQLIDVLRRIRAPVQTEPAKTFFDERYSG